MIPDQAPPYIPGLDSAALLERLGGDRETFWEVLQGFVEGSGASAPGLLALLDNDPDGLRHRVHDLKGVLGNIGADALFQTATELDALLRSGRSGAAGALLPGFTSDLKRLCDEIGTACPGTVSPPPPSQDIDAEALAEQFAALAAALGGGRARDAREVLDGLRRTRLPAARQALVERLGPLVEHYRLRDALRLLEEAGHDE